MTGATDDISGRARLLLIRVSIGRGRVPRARFLLAGPSSSIIIWPAVICVAPAGDPRAEIDPIRWTFNNRAQVSNERLRGSAAAAAG